MITSKTTLFGCGEIKTCRPPNPFYWDNLHHLYIGILVIVLGLYLKNNLIILLGILGVLDDTIEHTKTADTPLRLLYEYFIEGKIPDCLISCPTS